MWSIRTMDHHSVLERRDVLTLPQRGEPGGRRARCSKPVTAAQTLRDSTELGLLGGQGRTDRTGCGAAAAGGPGQLFNGGASASQEERALEVTAGRLPEDTPSATEMASFSLRVSSYTHQCHTSATHQCHDSGSQARNTQHTAWGRGPQLTSFCITPPPAARCFLGAQAQGHGDLLPGAASDPLPSPGSSRWWGSGRRTRSAPAEARRCQARSGRRGARAWSGAGHARSPRWPGCTSLWTAPPGQRSSRGESPSRSRPLWRHSGQPALSSSLPDCGPEQEHRAEGELRGQSRGVRQGLLGGRPHPNPRGRRCPSETSKWQRREFCRSPS